MVADDVEYLYHVVTIGVQNSSEMRSGTSGIVEFSAAWGGAF
jgi:hypothetical protein